MTKFILRFGAAFLTLTIGVACNSLINRAVERWIETPKPVLKEPCADALVQSLTPPSKSCGQLLVEIRDDRSIELNGKRIGTLDDMSRLFLTLERIFQRRAADRIYRPGFEQNLDVSEGERVEKTVLIKAPRGISYGELSDLVEVIKTAGARPIGLITEWCIH